MLHEGTIEAGTLDLIKRLSADKALHDFVLVGGTALALQLGHRRSIDIDMFIPKAFDAESIVKHLEAVYGAIHTGVLGNAATGDIGKVSAIFMAHQYPWVKPPQELEGIRMASLDDIGAMKLNAIVNSGDRLKDYVDVHTLLEHRNLEQLMNAYIKKYAGSSKIIARNALLYHKEIDFSTRVDMMKGPLKWPAIQRRLQDAANEPKRLFQGKDASIQKDQGEDVSKGLRRGRGR